MSVEIVNSALRLLQQRELASLDDDNAVARLMRNAYPVARDEVTVAYEWGDAITRTTLAADSTAPAFGYGYQYRVPTDCLRVLTINYDGLSNTLITDYQREGRFILTDHTAPLYVRYLRQMEDPNDISPLFKKAIACALAVAIGRKLTGKSNYINEARLQYREALREAKRIDRLSTGAKTPKANHLLQARVR